ncbi:MAG: hypothetical protein LCH38_10870 [Proteobacteria bacterium]|nr:hypothetical protein [Pseudomonadota bacterium]
MDKVEWEALRAAKALTKREEAKAARRARAKRGADPSGGKIVAGTRIVPDPIETGASLQVRVNLAEHPLEMMRARGRLDVGQYEAGTRFRAIYERAMVGASQAIDYGRMRVDGGRGRDPLPESCAAAHLELARLARMLGQVGYAIVSAVAGQGETVTMLAARWPGAEAGRAKLDYLTMRLREALDVLSVEVWGATGPQRGRVQAVVIGDEIGISTRVEQKRSVG